MRNSLALSLLAALSGSTYAAPTSVSTNTRTASPQSQTIQAEELTESQKIMSEVRLRVGSELKDS